MQGTTLELAEHTAQVMVCLKIDVCLKNSHPPSCPSTAEILALSPRCDLGFKIADIRAPVSMHRFLKGNLTLIQGKN